MLHYLRFMHGLLIGLFDGGQVFATVPKIQKVTDNACLKFYEDMEGHNLHQAFQGDGMGVAYR